MQVGGVAPNVLDVVLVLVVVLALMRGWRQGAVAQVAVFGGFGLGLVVGVWAAPRIGGLFAEVPGPGTALLTLGIVFFAALLGQGLGRRIATRVRPAVYRGGMGRVDRAAGLTAGGVGLLLIVWLLSSVLAQGPFPGVAKQVRGSEVVQALDATLPPPPDVLAAIATYLDERGFPQVFAGPGRAVTAPPVSPTAPASALAAAAAGQPGTVQVRGIGCGAAVSAGSGFVTQPGFVVTNAHVVAGFGQLRVRDTEGEHRAVAIHVDPALDIAVLSVPDVRARAIDWTATPSTRGTEGATLGFPGGQQRMVVRPATVRARIDAVGRDIYAQATVRRQVLALATPVEQGDSGGPFITSAGRVGGVVFAGDPGDHATGYAITAEQVRPVVEGAISRNQEAGVGACRF